ncbi:hypothetical protein SUGI_1227200 [Cryptomeria japonica]|uniref:Uncharacterized protein n=1 Tax=Cryptomeria japonica TaxID=3369 RepID=A0AAD3NJM2_CRYJA|nr:hypothetical protein SUGI_1227200 [Cryptomeria japonica]
MKPAPTGRVGVRRSPALKMSRLVAGHHETYILWLQKLLRNRHPYPAYSIHEAGWEEIVGGWEALVGWGGPYNSMGSG